MLYGPLWISFPCFEGELGPLLSSLAQLMMIFIISDMSDGRIQLHGAWTAYIKHSALYLE